MSVLTERDLSKDVSIIDTNQHQSPKMTTRTFAAMHESRERHVSICNVSDQICTTVLDVCDHKWTLSLSDEHPTKGMTYQAWY